MNTKRTGFTLLECVIVVTIVCIIMAAIAPHAIRYQRDKAARLHAPMQATVASAPAYVPPLAVEAERPAVSRRGEPAAPAPELTIEWTEVSVSGAVPNAANDNAQLTWFSNNATKHRCVLGFRSDGVLVWRHVK